MSTRAVIAEPAGDGFRGRYHHFDGYPSGLGAELWWLQHARYQGDTQAMRAELIGAHPGGWSTIIGADWSQAPGFVDSFDYTCTTCGAEAWTHYAQYYEAHGLTRPEPWGGTICQVFDHLPERARGPERPQCYCHGLRSEAEQWIESWGDDGGTEWAYVLTDRALVIAERRWNGDGSHMVGMFGMGASESEGCWLAIAAVPWSEPEPDWSAIEGAEGVLI